MRNSNSQWKNNICEWQQRDKCKFGGVYPFFECMPVRFGPSVNHPARYERVFSLPRPISKFIIIIIIIMSQCVQFVTFLGNVSGFFLGRVLLYLHLNKELTQIYAINRCKMKFENKTRTRFRYFSYSRPHTHTHTNMNAHRKYTDSCCTKSSPVWLSQPNKKLCSLNKLEVGFSSFPATHYQQQQNSLLTF